MSEHAFDAAKRLNYRGYFYFPTLEPADQMTAWTREEVARKVNWLYNNFGAVSMIIDGLAIDEVDTGIWPKAVTSNPAFNKAVTARFDQECGEANIFDEAAKLNYYTGQFSVRQNIRLYGDCFIQKLHPGEGSTVPSVAFVPMWQVANASTTRFPQDQWRDGVRTNTRGRALQYRVLRNRDGTSHADVSADDMLHQHAVFLPGQRRGISGLASVARKLFTIDDIERAESNGVLLRAIPAYVIQRAEGDDGGAALLPGTKHVEEQKTPDGQTIRVQKVMAGDGAEVSVADLPHGWDMKVVESNRALSSMEFTKVLLSDVAYSQLMPPEYVFFLSGLGQGTVARLVLQRVQRIINFHREHQIKPQYCKPIYNFWLWHRIKSGIFDGVAGGVPDDWWAVKHNSPALMTVDLGREGRLYDERLETGKMSPETYHGMQGEDPDDVEDEVLATEIRRAKKLAAAKAANPDLDIRNPWAAKPAATAAPPPPANPDDEDPAKKKDQEED
jgi:capsid protein